MGASEKLNSKNLILPSVGGAYTSTTSSVHSCLSLELVVSCFLAVAFFLIPFLSFAIIVPPLISSLIYCHTKGVFWRDTFEGSKELSSLRNATFRVLVRHRRSEESASLGSGYYSAQMLPSQPPLPIVAVMMLSSDWSKN